MTEADIEIILQGAKEKHPEARPRIISDNGPQFIAKDFKEFIRISGMTHVRTSPFYPQSNGKIERWHKSLKGECIRPGTPLSLDDARRLVEGYVDHYNNVRLNCVTGYITPKDTLAGRQQEIHADRDRKLEAARKMRKDRRQQAALGAETPGHWSLLLMIGEFRPSKGAKVSTSCLSTIQTRCGQFARRKPPLSTRLEGKMRNDYSFAYSALACLRTGMSGSASFQRARKS